MSSQIHPIRAEFEVQAVPTKFHSAIWHSVLSAISVPSLATPPVPLQYIILVKRGQQGKPGPVSHQHTPHREIALIDTGSLTS